jgi:hypothetical protein
MKQIYIRCTPYSRLELVLILCSQNCIDWAHGGESFVRITHHFVEGAVASDHSVYTPFISAAVQWASQVPFPHTLF